MESVVSASNIRIAGRVQVAIIVMVVQISGSAINVLLAAISARLRLFVIHVRLDTRNRVVFVTTRAMFVLHAVRKQMNVLSARVVTTYRVAFPIKV